MIQDILTALLNNAALLLVLSVIFEVTYMLPARFNRVRPYLSGLMIAMICIAVMIRPFTFRPGLFYDTRSIIISVTALVFGLVPTAIAAAAAVIYRLFIGGAGTLPGVLTILSSALIGLAWRRGMHQRFGKTHWLSVFYMSITVHVVMLAWMLFLPSPENQTVIQTIALPVLLIYPIVSVLLGLLLLRQQKYKTIQEQLGKSEERFRALFDKAPLGYQSLDINGNFIDVNQQWLDMLGYSREEVVGCWFGDFLAPEYVDSFRRNFEAFKQNGSIHSEFEMLHKNGARISISFEGRIAYHADGVIRQTHCILQDVTRQEAAEEKLRISEEKHRRLFETMAQGVIYQSQTGEIISANPAAERILGMSLDQMQGRTSMDPSWRAIREDGSALPGSEHPAMIALRTGEPFGPFTMGVIHAGTDDYVWLSINAIPLFQEGEAKPHMVYATFQDITAERKANRDYQLLFNEMVDSFALHEIILDGEGHPIDYRFLAVNPAFERMTGLRGADILGKTVLEVLPKTEQFWIERYGAVALSGEPARFSSYSVSSDKYFEVSAYQPAPLQFACTFSDVTKRVQAEEETKEVLSRLKSLLENSPSPIVIIDENGQVIEESSAAKQYFSQRREPSDEENAANAALPEITQKVHKLMTRQTGMEKFVEDLDVFEHKGNKLYFESRFFPIKSLENRDRLYGYLAVDVTQRILAEQALKESEDQYFSYIENAPFGIFVVNSKGQYVDVNRYASAMTGYSRERLLEMSILDIAAEESAETASASFNMLKETGRIEVDLRYVHENGSLRWWAIDAVKLSEDRYLSFQIDITEKRNAEAQLRHLINHDHLTGLFNRRYFEEELKRIDKNCRLPLTIMIGDINGVKLVNDAFGHAEGDRLIVDCVKIVEKCLRSGDTFARIGGDEFGILMPDTENATAIEVLQQIQDELRAFDRNAGTDKFIHSISLGFATKTTADEDVSQISRIAEEYMYQRKLLEHNSSHSTIISSIKATMNETSHETAEHADRLVGLSKAIAIKLALQQIDQDRLELLATLHDIGKVGISESILKKPSSLNEHEWVEMRRHPEIGYRIANSTPDLIPIAESILCHHEWWDGRGYPQGLKGIRIPLLSRILSIVDAYDAMTQDRPYRSAMSHEDAIAEIVRCSGTQFDPEIAQILIDHFQ